MAKYLLLPLFKEVHILEQSPPLIAQAHAFIGKEDSPRTELLCQGMQVCTSWECIYSPLSRHIFTGFHPFKRNLRCGVDPGELYASSIYFSLSYLCFISVGDRPSHRSRFGIISTKVSEGSIIIRSSVNHS